VPVSPENARRVAVFLALVFFGGRAVINSPALQKERLTRRETQEDIAEFFARVEKVHPNHLAYLSADEYAVLKATTTARAEAGMDELGRISVRDLATILYRSAAALGDGHTRLHWRPQRKWNDPERRYPPFTLDYRRGEFVIDRAENPGLTGCALLEMNGKPFKTFIAPATDLISGETPQFRANGFCLDQYLWWDLTGLLAGAQEIQIKVKNPAGKLIVSKVRTATGSEFRRLPQPNKDAWRVIYKKKSVAWVSFSQMTYSRAQRKAWDGLFKELKGSGIKALVIDVSRNGGGNSQIGDYVLSGLTKFEGKTYLIIGPGTFSSAILFTSAFRHLKAGEIIGEESGGTADHYGWPETYKLSNSGIEYAVSTRHYTSPDPLPGDGTRGIMPDVPVTESALRPYGGNLRNFVLALIEKERGSPAAVNASGR
jgi:hypothetical protein